MKFIQISKLNHYSRITYKLTDVQIVQKFSALLKRFLNNKNIPLIHLLFHGNEFVTNFKKKAKRFDSFFAKQCFLISNSSGLVLSFYYATEKRLDTLNFSDNDIKKIIENFDPNKFHDPDKIVFA